MPVSRGTARNQRGKGVASRPASGPAPLVTKQPVRAEANSGTYGDRKAAVEQQQAAPMRAGGVPTPTPTDGAGAGDAVQTPIDVFGPSNRPNEPVTAGIPTGPGSSGFSPADDVSSALRAAYRVTQSPYLLRLLSVLDG